MVTVRHHGGRFTVVSVPPTLELGPENVEELIGFVGLETAIENNPQISPERKGFLLRRLPYWQDWVAQGSKGIMEAGAFE